MTGFEVIVAADRENGIGRAGGLPWRLAGDMAHFRKLTTRAPSEHLRNAVVMGRKTWDSIPPAFRPLKRRLNLVVTRSPSLEVDLGVVVAASLEDALAKATRAPGVERVFLIGGGTLYREGLALSGCRLVHLTRVDGVFDCDTFLPELGEEFERRSCSDWQAEAGVRYRFEVYERVD